MPHNRAKRQICQKEPPTRTETAPPDKSDARNDPEAAPTAHRLSPRHWEMEFWPIDRLIFYVRNPRKNDAAVERMCGSIREFGFKYPVLARSDGEVVDGHLRLKAARKLDIQEVPVILCDEWTPAQVRAFRLLVNRSVNWAEWDDELLALELQELAAVDFDLSLTGFDTSELDGLMGACGNPVDPDSAPPAPDNPVSRPDDLWLCGEGDQVHRVLCGDATDASMWRACWAIARLSLWSRILRMGLAWTRSGGIAPD